MSLDPNLTNRFEKFVTEFVESHSATEVDGAYYDLPGTIVYTQATIKLPDKGKLEVNISNPLVRDKFSWKAEIMLDRRAHDIYKHVLINNDGSIVETYGKQVIEVGEESALEILKQLEIAKSLSV